MFPEVFMYYVENHIFIEYVYNVRKAMYKIDDVKELIFYTYVYTTSGIVIKLIYVKKIVN